MYEYGVIVSAKYISMYEYIENNQLEFGNCIVNLYLRLSARRNRESAFDCETLIECALSIAPPKCQIEQKIDK